MYSPSHTQTFTLPFFLQIDVFSTCVDVTQLQLPSNGVCILWEWNWNDDHIEMDSQGSATFPNESSSEALSEFEASHIEDDRSSVATTTHTITFKCIGATPSPKFQETLKYSSELLEDGCEVSMTSSEVTNLNDSHAIAFRANIAYNLVDKYGSTKIL